MKRVLLFSACLLVALCASAQQVEEQQNDTTSCTSCYRQTKPQYPGGEEALMKFLRKEVKYPKASKKAGVEGRVVVQFVVTQTGDIDNIKIVDSLDKYCDAEAIRVVKKLSRFTPGTLNGMPVKVRYTLPIRFMEYGDY